MIGGLKLGGKLDRYVTRVFLASYATAFLLVVGLFLIVDMAAHLDDYLRPDEDGDSASMVDVARYYALHMPFLYLRMTPYVTLVAGLFSAARIVNRNEMLAALGAGIGSRRLFLPVFAIAVALSGGMFMLREWATETLGTERQALRDRLENRRASPVLSNFWVRDLTGRSVRIGEYRPHGGPHGLPEIRGLSSRYRVGERSVAILAERAWPVPGEERGRWRLEDGFRRTVGPEEQRKEPISLLEEIVFTPRDLELAWKGRELPEDLSFSEARRLLERDPDNGQYRTLRQYQLSFPLAGVALLMVGIPLVLGRERRRGGERIAAGVLLCGLFFGLDFVCRSLGLQGRIGPMTAAWIPVAAFACLGAVLFPSQRS